MTTDCKRMFTPTLCDASQTHRTGNHTTIHHTEMFMRSSTVVTEIKYHRIKTMANTCMKQSCIRSIFAYTLYVRYVSTFYAVVFFYCVYVVVLNKHIYVSVIYVFIYWCLLLCVHGLFY